MPAGPPAGSNVIAKRAAARWFCCRIRPICRFTVAGSSRFFASGDPRRQAFERRVDPTAELVVHGLLFAAPVGRAAQDHGLAGLGVARELDLDPLMDHAPAVGAGKLGAELLQLRLRRADDVAPAGLTQPCQIGGTGHAAVGDPHPSQHAMPGLHDGHDRLQGPRVVGVAGEQLVAQGKSVEGHDERDAHLLAVGPMITGIAALGLRVRPGLAFEVCARDIVEQHLVLHRKQLAAALRQMRFKLGLVREQVIEPAIEAILVDCFVPELQQIAERRAPVPVLGNVQLARRLAQSRCYQHRRHLRPADAFSARRQEPLAQLLQPRPTPQRQRQIHVAEPTRALDANALQTHRDGQIFATVPKELGLLGRADEPMRQRPRLNAPTLIELAKMRHRLLDDTPSNAHAAHQPPIAMNLPVLPASRVTQIHASSQPAPLQKKRPEVGTTRPNPLRALPNSLI
jgi:hypothetical protein